MIVAKKSSEKSSGKSSGKSNAEMFDDIPVLQRKWQAALRPGERLPRYEDVMLGSLGRLADHIVLLKHNHTTLEVSRTGRYVQKWLGDDRWDIPLSALSPDCATALGEAAARALANGRPYLATAHCVRDGLVKTYDVLAMPTSSRWGGTLIGAYVNERNAQYNLALALIKLHRYELANEHAQRAYALGHPLPGLRAQLIAVGAWNPNALAKVPAAATPQ